MICLQCGKDVNYPDRPNRTCPHCKARWAFEPREGDRITDKAFQALIDEVSAGGRVAFGREHVYYAYCRRFVRSQKKTRRNLYIGVGVTGVLFCVLPWGVNFFPLLPGAAMAGIALSNGVRQRPEVPVPESEFNELWTKWRRAHGDPKGLFVRPEYNKEKVPPAMAAELAGFSFDRAVICDRARTADLLIANNFHFENNCAVLTIDGYPEYAFDVVRQMLRENPRLTVYALHDCSPAGCRMAHRLASEYAWFKDRAKVVDVGLRPAQADAWRGYFLPPLDRGAKKGAGMTDAEHAWTDRQLLELAVLTPEQLIKRLHKAIIANEAKERDEGGGGDVELEGETNAWGEAGWAADVDSLAADASASDGGADGFG